MDPHWNLSANIQQKSFWIKRQPAIQSCSSHFFPVIFWAFSEKKLASQVHQSYQLYKPRPYDPPAITWHPSLESLEAIQFLDSKIKESQQSQPNWEGLSDSWLLHFSFWEKTVSIKSVTTIQLHQCNMSISSSGNTWMNWHGWLCFNKTWFMDFEK